MEIIEYIPHFLRDVLEYKNISTIETSELQKVADDIDYVFKNQFIGSADAYGLSRFESYIHSFSTANDDLETRRKKLLMVTLENRPYTMKSIEKMLSLFFGDYGFDLELNGFELTIKTNYEFDGDTKLVETFLRNVLPANIYYHLNLRENTHLDYSAYTHAQLSAYTHEELMKGLK